MTKARVIKKILNLTGRAGDSNSFDKLNDMSEEYLNKLVSVIEKLKNAVQGNRRSRHLRT